MIALRPLVRLIAWDVRLQARENVYAFTLLTTAVFAGVLSLLPEDAPATVLSALLFLDPAIVGLSFVGAMVLMERSQNTLAALAVAPIEPREYVLAKVLTLTGLTFAGGMALVWTAYWPVSFAMVMRFALAVGFTGTLAVVAGLLIIAKSRSMNHFIARLFPLTALLNLPLLAHFDLVRGPWVWFLFGPNPGHAMLRALLWAADPESVSTAEVVYAFTFMGLLVAAASHLALMLYGEDLARSQE